MNGLASTDAHIVRKQVQYHQLVDKLQVVWRDEWRISDGLSPESGEKGHFIPPDVCRLVSTLIDEHQQGRKRGSNADVRFFSQFLDYSDKSKIPPDFLREWEDAKEWFKGHAHLPDKPFGAKADTELAKHFKCLDKYLLIAASSRLSRLQELDELLNGTKPTHQVIEAALESIKAAPDRQYFFSRLNSPVWVDPMRERGYFSQPPRVKELPEGYVQYPPWPELSYLVSIADQKPDKVIEIVQSLPETDNPLVYGQILAIALKIDGAKSAKLKLKIIEYINHDNPIFAYRYPDLLKHWADQGIIDEALELAKLLVPFRRDPMAEEKQQSRKADPNSPYATLEPAPRFSKWEYQQILDIGVRALVEREPYQVCCILIHSVARMVRLGMHQEEFDQGSDQDYSEIWCPRLASSDANYQDSKSTLVHTLFYACERVFEHAPDSIDDLDQLLKGHRWKVFERLRQQLYASHPSDQTLDWIRKEIIGYSDYAEREYHYELQLMIRQACEHFGLELLKDDEQKNIVADILSGPSREFFREQERENFSEGDFQRRQRYLHRMQLRPFSAVLSGNVRKYFDELEAEETAEVINDDSYLRFSGVTASIVSYQSPKSAEDLEDLSDDELLTFLNDWNKPQHRDEGNRLVEINIAQLADVFQSLFREKIAPNGERLSFWLTNRDQIARPVYIASMLKAMTVIVKEGHFDNLHIWISFCEWVLSHPDRARVEGQPEPRDDSHDHSDWGSSRRNAIDFIDACISQELETPISARHAIAGLLRQACCHFDRGLDHDSPLLPYSGDAITEAINNTRSRALESLVKFCFWVRRELPEDQLQELAEILDKRIAADAEIPLTKPEHALLGMHFTNLCILDQSLASRQRNGLFPQENLPVWRDAFSSYTRVNNPNKVAFQVLQSEYEFAVEHLSILESEDFVDKDDWHPTPDDCIDKLGRHLFVYYLWEVYPLSGENSLLERFYERTSDDRGRWGQLFRYVGRSLRSSGTRLSEAEFDRVVGFFDWRLKVAESQELQEFAFWLEAECLSSKWRLQTFLKILDLGGAKDSDLSIQFRALSDLIPNHLGLVVQCFAKVTQTMDQDTQIYVLADEARPILKAGLTSEDPEVRKNAEDARENLLRVGRFDFLSL